MTMWIAIYLIAGLCLGEFYLRTGKKSSKGKTATIYLMWIMFGPLAFVFVFPFVIVAKTILKLRR